MGCVGEMGKPSKGAFANPFRFDDQDMPERSKKGVVNPVGQQFSSLPFHLQARRQQDKPDERLHPPGSQFTKIIVGGHRDPVLRERSTSLLDIRQSVAVFQGPENIMAK